MLSLHLVSQCGWDIWTCFANQNQYSNSKRVSIELGRKFISLHLDDQATLKRNIVLNQLRLIQRLSLIGGFNVIRAVDVLFEFDWTDGMLTSHVKSGKCLVAGKFEILRSNLELVFVWHCM